jgi:hypothetical protein
LGREWSSQRKLGSRNDGWLLTLGNTGFQLSLE